MVLLGPITTPPPLGLHAGPTPLRGGLRGPAEPRDVPPPLACVQALRHCEVACMVPSSATFHTQQQQRQLQQLLLGGGSSSSASMALPMTACVWVGEPPRG